MKFSGLFEDRFVHQVQVVGYIHEWDPLKDTERKGSFAYWGDHSSPIPAEVSCSPRAGTAVDGSKTVHGAKVYWPEKKLPIIPKDLSTRLRYRTEDDIWELLSKDKIVGEYNTDDLRIAVVYRAKCFTNEAEAKTYNSQFKLHNSPHNLNLEQVLGTFAEDLVAEGLVKDADYALNEMPRLDLALLLLDTYIKYPFPSQDPKNGIASMILPFNYCMAPKLAPESFAPLLSFLLSPICSY